jgi:hypothetical protein
MYGGRPSQYNAASLQGNLSRLRQVGFILPDEELTDVINYARREKASLQVLASLGSGKQEVVELTFDRNNTGVPNMVDSKDHLATIRDGAYDQESYQNIDFRWIGKSVAVEVPMAGDIACVQFEAFRAVTGAQHDIVKIEGGNASPEFFDLSGSSLDQRKLVEVTLHGGGDSPIFHFEAQMPEIQFPNDRRKIAWGIVLPVTVDPGKACVNR